MHVWADTWASFTGYRFYPPVRRSLDAALTALALTPETAGLRALGRRRDSVLFRVDTCSAAAPNGWIIKIPLNAARSARWDVVGEVQRLQQLAARAPTGERYWPLHPGPYGRDPTFLALPFFPSRSLRESLVLAASGSALPATAAACRNAGRWLGQFRSTTGPGEPHPHGMNSTFANARIDEIRSVDRLSAAAAANLRDYFADQLENPEPAARNRRWAGLPLHGDFVADNILVADDGRLCVIDPEPIDAAPAGDFGRFREYLVIFGHRRPGTPAASWTEAARAFSAGYAEELPTEALEPAACAYVYRIVTWLGWYLTQGHRQRIGLGWRGLLLRYDRHRLAVHWLGWLEQNALMPGPLWPRVADQL